MLATAVRTDVQGLERLVDLPKEVARVRWEHIHKNNQSSLRAVVWLPRPGIESLLRESPKLDVQSPVTIDAALLGDEARRTGQEVSSQWEGVNIEPRVFVNRTKSGLLNGVATAVADQGFVYLALYEM